MIHLYSHIQARALFIHSMYSLLEKGSYRFLQHRGVGYIMDYEKKVRLLLNQIKSHSNHDLKRLFNHQNKLQRNLQLIRNLNHKNHGEVQFIHGPTITVM